MDKFKFVMPASLSKSDSGDWTIEGLASTNSIDQQGETIEQVGMDLTPIDSGKGWFNWDHKPGIGNLLGTLDSYRKTEKGLFVKGKLFKNKQLSKDIYDVMSSLSKSDQGRVGMSVEGKIIERCTINPKIIKKCKINKVALTLNPVNTDTYVDLVKSLNVESDNLIKSIVNSEIDFNSTKEHFDKTENDAIFTASQVVEIVQKALGVGSGYTQAPNELSGGSALATSDIKLKEEEELKKRKLKKGNISFFVKGVTDTLDQLQVLYPDNSRSQLWEALKDRLTTKYPELTKGIRVNIKQEDAKEREHKLYEDARQRSDYQENKTKNRAQLAEIARDEGTGKKEQAQIRAQSDAAIQEGEDRDHVRPGISE